MPDQISELTTNRLSLYLRFLNELYGKGVRTVSSKTLAEQFGMKAALIRKDLAHFGALGVRGVGYVVEDLRRELRSILGLDRELGVAIVGAGNLGLALADYPGFRQEGFRIVALFDNLRTKVVVAAGGVAFHDTMAHADAPREAITDCGDRGCPASERLVPRVGGGGHHGPCSISPRALRVPGADQAQASPTVSLRSLSFYLAREAGRNQKRD